MTKNKTWSDRIDQFGRHHPRLVFFVSGILMMVVTLTLLATTEAPIVLYQAF